MYSRYFFTLKIFILLSVICNLTSPKNSKYYLDKNKQYYLLNREKKDTDAVSNLLENAKDFFKEGEESEEYNEGEADEEYKEGEEDGKYEDYEDYEDIDKDTENTKNIIDNEKDDILLDEVDQMSSTGLHTTTPVITTGVSIITTEISGEEISNLTLPSVVTTTISQPITTTITTISNEKISSSTSVNVITTTTTTTTTSYPITTTKIIPNENKKIVVPPRAYSIYLKVLEELRKHSLRPIPDTLKQVHNYPETTINNTLRLENDLKKLTIE